MFNNIINTKTKDYVQSLLETDEVKEYIKARDEFENDADAKKLLSEFQQTQNTYAIFRDGGFDGTNEVEQKLRTLNNKLSQNKKIQALIRSQQVMQMFVGELVDDISKGIDFPFVKPQRGSCCG